MRFPAPEAVQKLGSFSAKQQQSQGDPGEMDYEPLSGIGSTTLAGAVTFLEPWAFLAPDEAP
jgi:hypothetical protein